MRDAWAALRPPVAVALPALGERLHAALGEPEKIFAELRRGLALGGEGAAELARLRGDWPRRICEGLAALRRARRGERPAGIARAATPEQLAAWSAELRAFMRQRWRALDATLFAAAQAHLTGAPVAIGAPAHVAPRDPRWAALAARAFAEPVRVVRFPVVAIVATDDARVQTIVAEFFEHADPVCGLHPASAAVMEIGADFSTAVQRAWAGARAACAGPPPLGCLWRGEGARRPLEGPSAGGAFAHAMLRALRGEPCDARIIVLATCAGEGALGPVAAEHLPAKIAAIAATPAIDTIATVPESLAAIRRLLSEKAIAPERLRAVAIGTTEH